MITERKKIMGGKLQLGRMIKTLIALLFFALFILIANSLVFNLKNVDRDGDLLSDQNEYLIGTNSLNIDTDNDGLNDFDEYNYWKNRSKNNLDNEFINIWKEYYYNNFKKNITIDEIKNFLLPSGDIDNDNISNICDIDSDNDKISDYMEILNNTDPAMPNQKFSKDNNSNNRGSGSSSNNTTVSPTKTEIQIISKTNIYKNSSFYVYGYVVDENNTGVSNTTVEIFINKTKESKGIFIGSGEVDSNGIFNVTCNIPDDTIVGSNHILAHSLGNKIYGDSWSDPIVEIYSDTKITLDMLDSFGKNISFPIKGKLTDSGDLSLSDKQINIKINGEKICQITTNKEGEFLVNCSTPTTGRYKINASFEGDEYLNSSYDTKIITIKDMGTYFDISILEEYYKRKDEINIQGGLYNSENNGLKNSNIEIFYNSKLFSNMNTSSNGFFEEKIIIPENSSLGLKTIRIFYPGNDTYGSAELLKKINIKSDTILNITQVKNRKIEDNNTILINGLLVDNYSTPLDNINVNIYSELIRSNTKTDIDGIFQFIVNIPKNTTSDTVDFLLYFNGSEKYTGSQKIISVKIESKNNIANNNLLIIIIALFLVGIGGVILTLLRKQDLNTDSSSIKKITIDSIKDLQKEKDLRQSVLKCYSNMCKWLDASGIKKGSSDTPREFAIELKDRLNVTDECLISLTKIFEKACYSKHEINLDDRDKTIRCLNEILSNLDEKNHINNDEKLG